MEEKRVYLFEMDSVIQDPDERAKAQELMFSEIRKGNTVVLSLNQVISTNAMDLLDVCQTDETRAALIALMEKGRIKLSMFRGFDTASAYIRSKVDPQKNENGGYQWPDFWYSSMHFLNRFKGENAPVFDDMYKVLCGDKSLISMRKSGFEGLSKEESKILCEYLQFIQDVTHKIEGIPATDDKQHKSLAYYVQTVMDAVLSEPASFGLSQPERDELKKIVAQMLSVENVYRTACVRVLHSLVDTYDPDLLRLARAILDMAYNYQVERSIGGITITHEMDSLSVATLVRKYYTTHNFTEIDSPAFPRESKILPWSLLNRFTPPKDSDLPLADYRKRVLRLGILKFLGVLFVISVGFVFSKYVGYFAGALGILWWLGSEAVGAFAPSSWMKDGWLSAVNLVRTVNMYRSCVKDKSYRSFYFKNWLLNVFRIGG